MLQFTNTYRQAIELLLKKHAHFQLDKITRAVFIFNVPLFLGKTIRLFY